MATKNRRTITVATGKTGGVVAVSVAAGTIGEAEGALTGVGVDSEAEADLTTGVDVAVGADAAGSTAAGVAASTAEGAVATVEGAVATVGDEDSTVGAAETATLGEAIGVDSTKGDSMTEKVSMAPIILKTRK